MKDWLSIYIFVCVNVSTYVFIRHGFFFFWRKDKKGGKREARNKKSIWRVLLLWETKKKREKSEEEWSDVETENNQQVLHTHTAAITFPFFFVVVPALPQHQRMHDTTGCKTAT